MSVMKNLWYISDYGKNSPKAKEFYSYTKNEGIPYDIKDYNGLTQHAWGNIELLDHIFEEVSDKLCIARKELDVTLDLIWNMIEGEEDIPAVYVEQFLDLGL